MTLKIKKANDNKQKNIKTIPEKSPKNLLQTSFNSGLIFDVISFLVTWMPSKTNKEQIRTYPYIEINTIILIFKMQ